MSANTILKVNLTLALLASLVHIPAALFFFDAVRNDIGIDRFILWLVVLIEISLVGSSIVGLKKYIFTWKSLTYQSAIFGFAALFIGYKVASYAICGFQGENFSFTIGLATGFCVYTAHMINKVYEYYTQGVLKYFPWLVGILVGASEIGMTWRFMELQNSLFQPPL